MSTKKPLTLNGAEIKAILVAHLRDQGKIPKGEVEIAFMQPRGDHKGLVQSPADLEMVVRCPPRSTTCPRCSCTSWNPNDVFFMWCDNCKVTYSDQKFRNKDRSILNEVRRDHPTWTLAKVVSALESRSMEEQPGTMDQSSPVELLQALIQAKHNLKESIERIDKMLNGSRIDERSSESLVSTGKLLRGTCSIMDRVGVGIPKGKDPLGRSPHGILLPIKSVAQVAHVVYDLKTSLSAAHGHVEEALMSRNANKDRERELKHACIETWRAVFYIRVLVGDKLKGPKDDDAWNALTKSLREAHVPQE